MAVAVAIKCAKGESQVVTPWYQYSNRGGLIGYLRSYISGCLPFGKVLNPAASVNLAKLSIS